MNDRRYEIDFPLREEETENGPKGKVGIVVLYSVGEYIRLRPLLTSNWLRYGPPEAPNGSVVRLNGTPPELSDEDFLQELVQSLKSFESEKQTWPEDLTTLMSEPFHGLVLGCSYAGFFNKTLYVSGTAFFRRRIPEGILADFRDCWINGFKQGRNLPSMGASNARPVHHAAVTKCLLNTGVVVRAGYDIRTNNLEGYLRG